MVVDIILNIAPVFITYYLVALGHGFFEKSGVLNLAIDGLFILAASVTFAVSVYTLNPWLGLLAAVIVDSLFGVFLAYVTTKFPVSHGAVGLSLMFLGYGLGLVVGTPANFYASAREINPADYTLKITTDIEIAMYVIPLLIGLLLLHILNYTKLGVAIRASGENPHAAASLGVDVLRTRLIAGAIGYALIGAGGAFFTLAWRSGWDPKLYLLGYGWIAFAISLSAGRHPLLTALNAWIFAGLVRYQFTIQVVAGLGTEAGKMLPFIAAIAAMVIFNITPLRKILATPASLGKIYYKEEKTV